MNLLAINGSPRKKGEYGDYPAACDERCSKNAIERKV